MHRHVDLDPEAMETLHPQPRQHAAELRAEPRADGPTRLPVRDQGHTSPAVQGHLPYPRGAKSFASSQNVREQPFSLGRRQELRQPHERAGPGTRRRSGWHSSAAQDGDQLRRARIVGIQCVQAPIRFERRGKLPLSPLDVAEPVQRLRIVRVRGEPLSQDRLGLVKESARTQQRG